MQGDGVDSKRIVKRLEKGYGTANFPFASIARDFKLIDETAWPVVVPYDGEAEKMIARLQAGERSRELLRGIQPYTVNIYPCSFEALKNGGWLDLLDEELGEGLALLVDMKKYGDDTGLDVQQDDMLFLCI